MPALFDNARRVLEDLDSMKDDPETASDAIEIDSQTITELDQLSQITKTELACEFGTVAFVLLAY